MTDSRELTHRHFCIACLQEVDAPTYFEHDFLCQACFEEAWPRVLTDRGAWQPKEEKIL